MLSRPRPGEPILLPICGEEYRIQFPLTVLKKMATKHGLSIKEIPRAITDPELLGMVLYYGLQTHHPDISLDWVELNVDGTLLLEALPTLLYAATGQWPEIDELKMLAQDRTPNPQRGTQDLNGLGSPSGPTDGMTLVSVNGTSGT